MRIIFMGTSEFSNPALRSLVENNYNVIAVYTQTPKPQGRGYKLKKSPVHILAETFNIPVYTPPSLRNEKEDAFFKNLNADIAIVAAYGKILPSSILNSPLLGCINIHASILPRWRGAAPIHRAILEGDKKTGITIMKMDEGLDTGEVLLKEEITIKHNETTYTLHEQLSALGADMLIKILPLYIKGSITPIPQSLSNITYAHKIEKNEGKIVWKLMCAKKVERMVRALSPSPGVWFEIHGERIKIIELGIESAISLKPGEHDITKNSWTIGCLEGAIKIISLQREGAKKTSIENFLRGNHFVMNKP